MIGNRTASNDRYEYVIRHLFTRILFLIPYSLSVIAKDQSIYNRLIADEGIEPLSSYKSQLKSFNLYTNSSYIYIDNLMNLYYKYLSRIREDSDGSYDGYGIPLTGMSNSYASISEICEHSKDRYQRKNMERRRKANYRLRKINMKYKYFKLKGINQF